jgi:hypothetical protein
MSASSSTMPTVVNLGVRGESLNFISCIKFIVLVIKGKTQAELWGERSSLRALK